MGLKEIGYEVVGCIQLFRVSVNWGAPVNMAMNLGGIS